MGYQMIYTPKHLDEQRGSATQQHMKITEP